METKKKPSPSRKPSFPSIKPPPFPNTPITNPIHSFPRTADGVMMAEETDETTLKVVAPDPNIKWYYKNGHVITAHRTLFGFRRRNVLIIGGAGILALIALIIGLAVGLTLKKGQDLPLPTDTGGIYNGQLTYYAPGLGACGITSSSTDLICAISHELFDSQQVGTNPNTNPFCLKKIRATRQREGVTGNVSVDVTVVDRCVGCQLYDLDFSPTAFSDMADMALGRVDVTWAFLD